jgi:hypothetical protein
MHYRIIEPENEIATSILRETLESLKDRDEMQSDYKKLVNCCGLLTSITIEKAPKPNINSYPNINNQSEELETYLL